MEKRTTRPVVERAHNSTVGTWGCLSGARGCAQPVSTAKLRHELKRPSPGLQSTGHPVLYGHNRTANSHDLKLPRDSPGQSGRPFFFRLFLTAWFEDR